jgi:hypothetical protein
MTDAKRPLLESMSWPPRGTPPQPARGHIADALVVGGPVQLSVEQQRRPQYVPRSARSPGIVRRWKREPAPPARKSTEAPTVVIRGAAVGPDRTNCERRTATALDEPTGEPAEVPSPAKRARTLVGAAPPVKLKAPPAVGRAGAGVGLAGTPQVGDTASALKMVFAAGRANVE